jgi:predicted NAD/FAD-dependent oxidoreductase
VAAWRANTISVQDSSGRVVVAAKPQQHEHYVATPGMNGLVKAWAAPLVDDGNVQLQTRVTQLMPDPLKKNGWQLHTESDDGGQHIYAGFDQVILAIPPAQAQALLEASGQSALAEPLKNVRVDPCWTLMLAFPNAMQPSFSTLGPQWNAARSTHHRIAWLARESSKPGREQIERWTVQASAAWSQEHLEDDAQRRVEQVDRRKAESSDDETADRGTRHGGDFKGRCVPSDRIAQCVGRK